MAKRRFPFIQLLVITMLILIFSTVFGYILYYLFSTSDALPSQSSNIPVVQTVELPDEAEILEEEPESMTLPDSPSDEPQPSGDSEDGTAITPEPPTSDLEDDRSGTEEAMSSVESDEAPSSLSESDEGALDQLQAETEPQASDDGLSGTVEEESAPDILPPVESVETGEETVPPQQAEVEEASESQTDTVPVDADVQPSDTSDNIQEVVEAGPEVPPVPVLFDPFVSVEELIISGSDEPVYDDDFFASFFVQGQDTIEYDDGLYYFEYSIDSDPVGTLEILFENGGRYMNASELQMYLSDMLTDEAYSRLFAGQGDYIDIEHFRNCGVSVDYDENEFTIDMSFSVSDMPERVISLASSDYYRRTYNLSGAEVLEPDFFSWRTSYNLYSSLDWHFGHDSFNWSLSLSLSNYLTFGPVNLDFFYSLGVRNGDFSINWNNYRFYHDFADQGLRLSWGNIYGFGLSPAGTPLGIQLEKGYSYGTLSSPYNSHREYITVTEESYLLIIRNGRTIFQRLVQPGNYRIQDFTFDSGFNEVEVMVIPSIYVEEGMNLSDERTRDSLEEVSVHQYFDMAYDSQLLSAGETLFGLSVSIGRTQIPVGQEDSATGLMLRLSPEYYYDYHFDNIAISWYQDVGLTDELTLMSDFSVLLDGEDSIGDLSLSLRGAWRLGTTTLSLDGRLDSTDASEHAGSTPMFYARLDHSFRFDMDMLRSLNFSLGYGNSRYNGWQGDELSLRLSLGGSLGLLRYSTSVNLMVEDYAFDDLQWRWSASAGISPVRNLSISAGITASHGYSGNDGLSVSGYLSASISFSGVGSASASTNFTGDMSLSASASAGERDSFSANISGLSFTDLSDHMLSGSWYHSGDLYGLSARVSTYENYNRLNLTTSLSTASFFSGGIFSFARSVRDNFLLVRPTGSLGGGTVQIARSNQGNAQDVRTLFGSAAYTNLSSWTRNNVVVYVTPDDEFGQTQTFAYELNPTNRSGYSVRLSVPQEYTVTGILLSDGVIQDTFSSPLYRVEHADDGSASLVSDIALYLFADQDGRFIVSGVTPGEYIFDFSYDGAWYAVRFVVEERDDDDTRVVDFGQISFGPETEDTALFSSGFEGEIPSWLDGYDGRVDIEPVRLLDSTTFWNELFPPLSEEEIIDDFQTM